MRNVEPEIYKDLCRHGSDSVPGPRLTTVISGAPEPSGPGWIRNVEPEIDKDLCRHGGDSVPRPRLTAVIRGAPEPSGPGWIRKVEPGKDRFLILRFVKINKKNMSLATLAEFYLYV
jgi:hypothetical protein